MEQKPAGGSIDASVDSSTCADVEAADGVAGADQHSSPDTGPPLQQPQPCCEAPRRRRWGCLAALPRKREVVRQFTPSWFTVTMGTGSVAVSIWSFPWTFRGQQELALVVWLLTAALFVLFSCLLLGRALVWPRTIVSMLNHPTQSLFVGAIPMSVSTLTNGLVALWQPRVGLGAAHAAQVMFWVNLPAVLLCVLLVPFLMFASKHHNHAQNTMTAVWLLPVVPACVAANTAGIVASALPESSRGVGVVLLGMTLLGVGLLLSFNIAALYYGRLTCHSLPAREMIISSFLPTGPFAMSAMAVINLALAGNRHAAEYLQDAQVFEVALTAAEMRQLLAGALVSACLIAAFLYGYATWWLILAITAVTETFRRTRVPFSLGVWGAVFPWGVWAACACLIAKQMHSRAFAVIGAAAVCSHVVLWLVVVVLTAQRAYRGDLFHAPCLQQQAASAAAKVEARLQVAS